MMFRPRYSATAFAHIPWPEIEIMTTSRAGDADRNLLFGILALQMDFVTRDQLVAAMHAWVLDKSKPLADILVAQKALGPARHMLLDALVVEHLKQHEDDPVE